MSSTQDDQQVLGSNSSIPDLTSPCTHENSHRVELVLGPYVHSIICVLGLVGNSLVILTYAFYKRTKSMTDVYLLNVAVADLLFVVALPLIVYNELSAWSMGPVACKLLRGSYSVNMYSGMLLLACISADRYVAIVQARRSFRLRSLPHSRIICAIVWVLAVLLSIPSFYFFHWYQPRSPKMIPIGLNWTNLPEAMNESSSDFDYFELSDNQTGFLEGLLKDFEMENQTSAAPQYICEFRFSSNNEASTTKRAVPSIQLAVGFFLPLCIMVFCYAAVILTLLRAKNFQRHKAVRVVMAVVAVFLVCNLPYNMVLLYDTVTMFHTVSCAQSDNLQVAKTVTQTLAYLHCCLNPVLYAFIGVKFRNHFRRILRDLWCLGKTYMGPRRFSRVTSEVYVSSHRSVDGSSDNGSSFTM